jgi:hypothetical protein
MRLHESFASFLPVAAILLVVYFVCIKFNVGDAGSVYQWVKDPSLLDHFWGKKTWLKLDFMIWRDLFAMVLILGVAYWQLGLKLRRDRAMLGKDEKSALNQGVEAQQRLRYWSGPALLVYALAFSLLVFDLTMSLPKTFYSTLWGGWSFAIMMQTLMASLLIFMYGLKQTAIGQVYGKSQFHDVGKLMHGFTIFWAYLTYAHVLTYWYGNMPEFSEYYLARLESPWISFVIATPILCFVVPLFALIPKASKWTPGLTLPICGSILFAQWMTYLIVVAPETSGSMSSGLPWLEAGVFFGMLGLFLSAVLWFGKRFPMVSIGDPLLKEALSGGHH